jgi:hypothetical protein
LQLCEEIGEAVNGFRVHAAIYFLAVAIHFDEASLAQLLYMVRDGRRDDTEIGTELADACFHHVRIDTFACTCSATTYQTHEDIQAVRIGQGLEHSGVITVISISTIRHLSNYTKMRISSQGKIKIAFIALKTTFTVLGVWL